MDELSEDQVRAIAAKIGLEFTEGSAVSKEDYINILDEAYWDEMAAAYLEVTGAEFVVSGYSPK